MEYNFQLDFLNTVIILRTVQGEVLNVSKEIPVEFYQMEFLGNNIYYDGNNHKYWLKSIQMINSHDCEYYQEEYIEVTRLLLENKRLITDLKKDPLTQIGNVAAIDAKEQEILNLKKDCILVICDIDDFKTINDTFGHAIGDKVLQGVATILSKHRKNNHDLVSRVGGDEFLLIFEMNKVDIVIKKMAMVLDEVNKFGQELNVPLSVSIGVSLFESTDKLYNIRCNELQKRKQDADQALYYVKKNTAEKNNIAYFNSQTGEFELYYKKSEKVKRLNSDV